MLNSKIVLSEIKDFDDFERSMIKKYEKSVMFAISSHNGVSPETRHISLDRIEVKKHRRRSGCGTKFMTDLINYADHVQMRVELMPVPLAVEITKNRLEKFYRRFGFKYKKKQTCTMLRCPRRK
jgi:predicted GNAT family N-acyltransferase